MSRTPASMLLFIADIAFPRDLSLPIELFRKTVLGGLFVILPLLIAGICFCFGLNTSCNYFLIVSSTGCVAWKGVPGIIGMQLMFAKLPGK